MDLRDGSKRLGRLIGRTSVIAAIVGCSWAMSACGLPFGGGPTVTVTVPATGATTSNSTPPAGDLMQQAASVVQKRLDAAGLTGSSVVLRSRNQIAVSVRTTNAQTVVDLLSRRGQLGFRVAYQIAQSTPPPAATDTPARRVAPNLPTAPPTERPTTPGGNPSTSIPDLLNWQPTAQDIGDFANWSCGDPFPDVWDQPLFACDSNYQKYLLGPVVMQGQRVASAQAGIPQGGVAYQVMMNLDPIGTDEFAQVTAKLVDQTSPKNQFAMVMDGQVLSAPRVNEPITGGSAVITGAFTKDEATGLAASIGTLELPCAFEISNVVTGVTGVTTLTMTAVAG